MSYEASLRQHYASIRQRMWAMPKPNPIKVISAPEREPENVPAGMPEWKRIILEVCAKHNVSYADVTSRTRIKAISNARQECFYRLRCEARMSLPRIGRRLGCLDHTTVLHGCNAHAERNGLPKLTGAFYDRKWTDQTVAPLVALKTNHSTKEVAKITGKSVGAVAGVIRRERLARVERMKEWGQHT